MAGHGEDPVATFQAFTGCTDAAQARQYLANADGDVHLAAAIYTSMGGDAGGGSSGGGSGGWGGDQGDFAASLVEKAQKQAEEGGGDDEASGTVTITLWKNGFQVEEGDLRSYDDPVNREFMDAVHGGRVPRELQSRGTNLDVHLEDKSSETFKEPVKPRVLGTAQWGSAAPAPSGGPPAASGGASGRSSEPVDRVTNPSAPTTTLLLEMADGRRVKATFNTDATVRVLRETVAEVDGTGRGFRMQTHKGDRLDDDSCTMESLGLRRAKIAQIVQ